MSDVVEAHRRPLHSENALLDGRLSESVVARELLITVSSFALRWCIEQVRLRCVAEARRQARLVL